VQIADKRLPGYGMCRQLQEAGFKGRTCPGARIVGPPGMPADAVIYYEDLLAKMARSPLADSLEQSARILLHDAKATTAFLSDYGSARSATS